jgi:hypothetical protein
MIWLTPLFIATIFAFGPGSACATDATTQAQARPENQPPAQAEAALANPLAMQPLESLSVTRDRPLFSSNRRRPPPPPVAPPPQPAPPPPPPNLALVAIVLDASQAIAAVRSGPTEFTRLRIGDEVGGWKVSQIEGRKVVLSLDGRFATFTLFSQPSQAAGQALPNPLPQNQPQQNQLQPGAPTQPRRASK